MTFRQFCIDILTQTPGLFPSLARDTLLSNHNSCWETMQNLQLLKDLWVAHHQQLVGCDWQYFPIKHNAYTTKLSSYHDAMIKTFHQLPDGFFTNGRDFIPIQLKFHVMPHELSWQQWGTAWKDWLTNYTNQIVLLGVEHGPHLRFNAHHVCGHLPSSMLNETVRGLIQDCTHFNTPYSAGDQSLWAELIKSRAVSKPHLQELTPQAIKALGEIVKTSGVEGFGEHFQRACEKPEVQKLLKHISYS